MSQKSNSSQNSSENRSQKKTKKGISLPGVGEFKTMKFDDLKFLGLFDS